LAKAIDLASEWALACVAVLILLVHLLWKYAVGRGKRTVVIPLLLGVLLGAVYLVFELRSAAGPLRFVAFMALVIGVMAVVALAQVFLLQGIDGASSDTPEDGYLLEQDVVDEEEPEEEVTGSSGTVDIAPERSRITWPKLNMLAFFGALFLFMFEGRRGMENTLDALSLAGLGAVSGLLLALVLAWWRTPHVLRSYSRIVLRNGGVFWVVLPLICMATLSFVNRTFPQREERCRTWAVVDISRGRNMNVSVSWDGEPERLEMPRSIKEQLTTLDSLRCCVRTGLLGYDHVYSIEPVIADDLR
jgi:hypothetical protein